MMRKIDALILAIVATGPITSHAADACTVITIAPDEASRLVWACRSAMVPPNDFNRGYCQGYIDSKLRRLSKQKIAMIVARMNARHEQFGLGMMVEITKIIQSNRFNDRYFGEFRSGSPGWASADAVLDYIIDNLLYTEQP